MATTIIDRIKTYSDLKGISIRQIEATIGASNGVVSNAIKRERDIQSKWISAFVDNYRDVNPEWLLTGKGDMLLDESATRSTQHVTGNNNTFAGRDLTTATANIPELIAMTNQHQSTISELISTISKQQTTISELVTTVSRQQQDISLLIGHKSDQN
ncbi:hypothetical protein [uncultured Porphyromonas sp.]|uniref:hypothetical protein n=1 Tax=uncultured Porphyromonas sp. TaxID=159274 RepID=UPI00260AC737|nr:hypothetical protein [uncultured Porphyromonas sp.]